MARKVIPPTKVKDRSPNRLILAQNQDGFIRSWPTFKDDGPWLVTVKGFYCEVIKHTGP